MKYIDKTILKGVFVKRPSNAKKYDYGLVVVIGGSQFYTGSPAFAGMAAFRTGCDMVHVLAPKRAADIIAGYSPNLACYPLKGTWLDKEDLGDIVSLTLAGKQASNGNICVVIGGGLGRTEETQHTVIEYLKQVDVPCIIDADGIHALAKNPEVCKGKDFLITPHSQEFFVLSGQEVYDKTIGEKMNIVQRLAERLGATILLKGGKDVIISKKKQVAVNITGSPSMTVGGTGDVLAGIAGALMARGVDSFKSACAAAYINGSAGQRGAKKYGESMLATDLIEQIPKVLPKTV